MTNLIDELITRIHANAVAKGFYDTVPSNATQIALMHSELSEMLEVDRRVDTYALFQREGAGEKLELAENLAISEYEDEVADVFIRLLDHCGKNGINLFSAVMRKIIKNEARPRMHGNKRY